MISVCIFEGFKEKVSSKGNKYGEIFIKGLNEDGTVDLEQAKLRTFSDDVINMCKTLKTSEKIKLLFSINDANIILDDIRK